MKTIHSHAKAGFTLAELTVVLVVVSLGVLLVVPRVGSGRSGAEDQKFLDGLMRELAGARRACLSSGGQASFRINGEERVYFARGGEEKPIPANLEINGRGLIESSGRKGYEILFYPDGSSSGGRLEIIADRTRKYFINIDKLFGSIRLMREE